MCLKYYWITDSILDVLCWRQLVWFNWLLKLKLVWELCVTSPLQHAVSSPLVPAPCSPPLAFGGVLSFSFWTTNYLSLWLIPFLWWDPLSVLASMLWARVLKERWFLLLSYLGKATPGLPSLLHLRYQVPTTLFIAVFSSLGKVD